MKRITVKNLTVQYPLLDRGSRELKTKDVNNSDMSWGRIMAGPKPYVTAIDDISFSVKSGERVALLGKNGSGKTSLLRTIGNIIPPNSGQIDIDGSVAGIFNLRQGLKPESSGRRNIILRGICMGMTLEQIKTKQEEIEAFSKLGSYLDLPISTYSSGMLIRLVFSVVIVFKPDLMLLDEWIGTADESFQIRTEKWLKQYSQDGGTFILASHSRRLIQRMCDSGIVMKNGKIVFQGSIKDSFDEYSKIL